MRQSSSFRARQPRTPSAPQRLTERFGDDLGLDLVQYSEAVLAELYSLPPDWSRDDLRSATEKAVGRVRSSHPELSAEALTALGWSFSWDWK